MLSYKLTKYEFMDLLDEFSDCVPAYYRKVDYANWKLLKELTKYDRIYIDDWRGVYQITAGIKGYRCEDNDNSFGTFLSDTLADYCEPISEETINDKFEDYHALGTCSLSKSGTYSVSNNGTYSVNKSDNAINKTNNAMNEKENKEMKNFVNFDFGPISSSVVRMSMYGLAVKNKSDVYVSYDAKTGNIFDVDVFNFNGSKFLYKMPVAIKDIAVGDIVIHNKAPMFVVGINVAGKTLSVIDPINGEKKEILLTKSPFGFDFATKIVNFIGNVFDATPSEGNPFGNMWMYAMLGDSNSEIKEMLPFMMISGVNGFDASNPMAMMAMMSCFGDSNSNTKDMLPFMMMSMMNAPVSCKCGNGCNCGEAKTE